MKIFIGADHAGFGLKEQIASMLKENGHEVTDCGAHEFNTEDDYPDFIVPVARAVASDPERSRGIVIGGSGQGEAMCANRFKNVRAAVWYGPGRQLASDTETIIKLSREHNDANVLSIGARFVQEEEALEAVRQWLEATFSGEERHKRRLDKMSKIETA